MSTEKRDPAGQSRTEHGAWRRLSRRYQPRKQYRRPLPWLGYAFVTINLVAIAFFVLDAPLAVGAAKLPPPLINIAGTVTDIGRLHWLLFWTALALALGLFVAARVHDARRSFRLALVVSIAGYMTATLLLAALVSHLLKLGIGRARPPLFEQYGIFGFEPFQGEFSFLSFPSAHATHLGALFAAASFLFPRYRLIFVVLALWLAATRVMIGVHYPSDVIGGLALGAWTALAVAHFFARFGLIFSISPKGWPDLRLKHPLRQRMPPSGL